MLSAPQVFTQAAGTPDEKFGTAQLFSTFAPDEKLSDGYYFTDEWFLEDSSERNDALALLSMQLVAATVDEGIHQLGSKLLQEIWLPRCLAGWLIRSRVADSSRAADRSRVADSWNKPSAIWMKCNNRQAGS